MKAVAAHKNKPMHTRIELTWQDVRKIDRKLIEIMAVETMCDDDIIELENLSKRIKNKIDLCRLKFDKSKAL